MGLASVMYKGRKDERREKVEAEEMVAGGTSLSLSGAGAETKEIDMMEKSEGAINCLPSYPLLVLNLKGMIKSVKVYTVDTT